jgi:hypothetical protein
MSSVGQFHQSVFFSLAAVCCAAKGTEYIRGDRRLGQGQDEKR